MNIFLSKLLKFSAFCWILSIEFLIKFKKTLLSCSLSPLNKILSKDFWNSILILLSISDNKFILSLIIWTKSFSFNIGFGILAKSENSFTRLPIWLIWLFIILRFSSKLVLSLPSIVFEYFDLILSIVNWIGVSGFLISWASFLAKLPHASCLSFIINFSCCVFNRSIIKLKFLFKVSRSLSVLISGTFISKSPSPIAEDANIRLLIDLKNLEENLIAIDIDINKSNVTIIT